MKLKNLTICNFKNFRGENVINLLPDEKSKKNIILIGGNNGAGKTTLLDSIKLCLFGRRYNGLAKTIKSYNKFLIQAKNKNSIKESDNRFFIQIELDIDDIFPTYSIVVRREWELNENKIAKENFTILRDNIPFEIIPYDYWEDYILSLIPPYISDYFFFDGEKVKELATGDNAENILKDSIKDLIGLNLYETLSMDLENLISKIRRRNNGNNSTKSKIEEIESKLDSLKNEIMRKNDTIIKKNKNIKELIDQRKQIEVELKRKAGAFAKERENNNSQLLSLQREFDELNNIILQICSEVLPFIVIPDLSKELLHQLSIEKKLKELIASKHIIKDINKKLLIKLNSSKDFSTRDISSLKKEINSAFNEIVDEIKIDSRDRIIHDLSNAEIDYIRKFLNDTEKFAEDKLNNYLRLREKNLLKTKTIRGEIKLVPEEKFIQDYIDKITTINTKIELNEREIKELEDSLTFAIEEKEKNEKNLQSLQEEIVCVQEDLNKIEISEKTKKSIQEFMDELIELSTDELETIITEMYLNLANKDDMVKQINVDKKSFKTTLVDFDNGLVDKENISAGEKEIYALSVLWGLSRISHRNLPLIIDSPLSKLDKSHVDSIIKKFFPNAASQVIILSHDREIDQKLYNKLKPHVSASYTITFNEYDKIKEGYFSK